MNCSSCSGSYAQYYALGRLNVCEVCIKNTYVYKQLEQHVKGTDPFKFEPPKENKSEYKLPYFHISPSCMEYNSLCSQRVRLLEKIYMDIDKLKWEIDTDKYVGIKEDFNIKLLEAGNK